MRLRPAGSGREAAGLAWGLRVAGFASPGPSAAPGSGEPRALEARGAPAGRGRLTSHRGSCELKAPCTSRERHPGPPGPRAPESPSPHGLRWCEEEAAGREAPARSTHSLSSTQSTFLVLGGHSSSGVLSPCDVSSTLWPKRRNSIISVPSARLVVCPFSLYF